MKQIIEFNSDSLSHWLDWWSNKVVQTIISDSHTHLEPPALHDGTLAFGFAAPVVLVGIQVKVKRRIKESVIFIKEPLERIIDSLFSFPSHIFLQKWAPL